jgi:DNA-binding transcriptional ArsR family regulator
MIACPIMGAQHLASDRSRVSSVVLMFENTGIVNLAVGRSTVRRRILALMLTEPGTRLHLREIQRRANTSPGTASRELTKLVSAGLIEREAEGNQVYFCGSASPFATMLRSLLLTAPTLVPGSAATATTASGSRLGAEADPVALEAGTTIAEQMRAIYGERLRGVYLYGQRASGAPQDSDVELLVVLDRVDRYGEELDRTSTAIASVSLDLGVIVSRVFVSEADWLGRTDGQLPRVRAEAVSL